MLISAAGMKNYFLSVHRIESNLILLISTAGVRTIISISFYNT